MDRRKKVLRKKILEQFPSKDTYNRYIEVFGGAGWVLFADDSHAKMEVYNDINGNLVNLFRCVKHHPNAVQEELELILVSREQFFDAKEQLNVQGLTDIQRAARFYILLKESYGADHQSFGLKPRNLNKAKEYLTMVSKRLNTVVIENLDFQKILKNYDATDALFYLDPPYYEAEKYYPDRFMPEDHIRLKKSLDETKGMFVLTYNDCEFIRELYNEYTIISVERMHNLKEGEIKPRYRELIIKNYE